MEYEKFDPITGERFTWVQNESLEELARPERVAAIKANNIKQKQNAIKSQSNLGLKDVFGNDEEGMACLVCHL